MQAVSSGAAALEQLERGGIDAVITDLRMPGLDGMELVRRAKCAWPDVPVVMLTAHGTIDVAVAAMREGAVDFLVKKPLSRLR